MQRLQNYTVQNRFEMNRRKHTELAAISCGLTSWYLLRCLLRINYVTIYETHNWMFRCIYPRLKIIIPLRIPTPYCSVTSPYIS